MTLGRNLIGERFGLLTIVASHSKGRVLRTRWVCRCDCGNTVIRRSDALKVGQSSSCGCVSSRFKRKYELRGQHFGRLTVSHIARAEGKQAKWLCVCDCGKTILVDGSNLINGNTVSCGCKRREGPQSFTHRLTGTPEYRIWRGILNRCYNPRVKAFRSYGGSGIKVCNRWRFGENGRTGSELFIADMGPRPSKQHSIDRIDNAGDYEPSNCRWTTFDVQINNRGNTRFVVFRGKVTPLSVAARLAESIVHYETAWRRISDGWNVDDAFSTPPLPTNWPGRYRNSVARGTGTLSERRACDF